MSEHYFNQVKEIYASMDTSNKELVDWEEFCRKVTIVNSDSEFLSKLNGFLLTGMRARNLSKENTIFPHTS